jgi:molecular chaperone GrpE
MTVGEKGAVDNTPTAETADPKKDGQADEPVQSSQAEAAIGGEPGADGEPPKVVPLDPQVAALKTELEAAKQAAEQATTRLRAVSKAYTELQAEMKSFKERMEQRAKMDSELQAFDQVRAFFDPVMNLKRSMSSQAGDNDTLRQGIEMVYHQFMEALHKLGLAEVPGAGATFDPAIHEALGVQPVTDKALDGKVLTVHTTGFTVRGRVLQAAQVVIGKHEEVAGEA